MNRPDILIASIEKNTRLELHVLLRTWRGCQLVDQQLFAASITTGEMRPTHDGVAMPIDRIIWDQLQMLADTDYRDSFRRMEKRLKDATGQQFWWQLGEAVPSRAPNPRAVLQ
jgi:hypothetical protein